MLFQSGPLLLKFEIDIMNAVVVDNFNSILQSPFLAIVVTLAIVILSRVFWRRFFFKQQRLEIEALFVYPVKSCAGISVKSWPVGQYGFVDDRTWVVVDSTSGFQTQREYPRMALIQPSYKKNNTILCLNAPGMPELQIDRTKPPPGKRVQLGIWEDPRPANEESQECHGIYITRNEKKNKKTNNNDNSNIIIYFF